MHTQRSGANAPKLFAFDQAETRRAQAGAQLAHVPISPAQLEYQLNTWAMQGEKYEKRNEAKQRILEAHRTGTDRLDLNELFLSTLPENIGALTNLQTLNLNVNQLTTLPESIGKLTNLKEFSVDDNPLEYLPSALADFQKRYVGDLGYLPLRDHAETNRAQADAPLAHVPISPAQLDQLNTWVTQGKKYEKRNEAKQLILEAHRTGADQLSLHCLNLRTLPECIWELTNLQKLNVNGNNLTRVPENIVKLTKLQTLHLGNNKLTTLPESICKLTNLQELVLFRNELTTLPESICMLTNLRILVLNNNQLTMLPERIGKLFNLQKLELSINQLTTLPKSIEKLTKLRRLELGYNPPTTLSKSIWKLTNLQELLLFGNELTTLSKSIGKLTNLQSLDISRNPGTTLPKSISKLTNLRTLDLADNQLSTPPESVKKLTNLQSLSLGSNKLTTLPKSVENLTNLQSLDLADNQLTTLPESIGKLTDLKQLFIANNPLEYLPGALADFQRQHGGALRGLPLRDPAPRQANQHIATLPKSISKLPVPKGFSIGNNRYGHLPSSVVDYQKRHGKSVIYLPLRDLVPRQANQQIATLPESINKLSDLKESSIRNKPLEYLPSALAEFQSQHDDALRELPLRDPAPSQVSQSVPNIDPAPSQVSQSVPNIDPAPSQVSQSVPNVGPAPSQVSQSVPNIDPAELEALRNLKNLTLDLNSMLADLKNIDSLGEQLHAVAQAQQGVVRLSALPKRLASIPQCAQFYQVALQLLLRGWAVHKALACEITRANHRVWVTGIQTAFKAAPVPFLKMAGVGFATLVNQIDTVMQGSKGQLLLNRFNSSEVKFEQVAHTVASRCTELLESELRALPENNKDQKPIGLGKQLKALYNECEALAQRLNLQAKPLVNPLYPAANKADELMSLLLHKLCAQPVDEGRAGAMPQAHEDNFVERMSNYCVELLLPNASNTLVVGRKLLGNKAFALAPNGGSSQDRASSPPRSISPNSFARAMAEKDAAIAKLELRITDLQAKAEAASTLAETADRNASEAKQQISTVGLRKQSAQQVQHNLGRRLLTQSHYGTEASQGSMGFQPAMGIGQYPIELKTLNERVDTLDHIVADLRQFDLLDTPLSALEYGRVVAAYLQEHGRLHSDGTVKLNNKQGDFKNRKLLEKLKDIHNVENRGVEYNLCIELPALLKKMPDAAYMNPRIPRNTMKLQELLDAEKTGLQKPCPKGETASGNFDINSERSQLLGLGNRFQWKKHP